MGLMKPRGLGAAALFVLLAGEVPLVAQETKEAPLQAGSEGVPVPKRSKTVPPTYPPEAQAAGIRGIVILELVVDPQGKVESVNVIRSVPGLDEAATEAAKQWEYEITKVNGKPVSVRLTVPITFAMRLPEVSRQEGIPELRQGAAPGFPEGERGSAEVAAEMTIDGDGLVTEIRVTNGEAPWTDTMLRALRTWRFAAPSEGNPISFRVQAEFVPARGRDAQRVALKLDNLRRSETFASTPTTASAPPPTTVASAPIPPATTPSAPANTPPFTTLPAPIPPPPATAPPTLATPPPAPATVPPAPATIPPAPATVPPAAPPTTAPPAPVKASPPPTTPAAPPVSSPATPPTTSPAAPPARPAPPTAGSPQAPPAQTPSAPSVLGKTAPAPPPVEVISAPPPPEPAETGSSAVRDVLLAESGVPDLARGRRPVVPPFARMTGTQGSVEVDFSVGASGTTNVQSVKGPDLLRPAAEQTVLSWIFRRTKVERLFLIALFKYEGDKVTASVKPQEAAPPTP